MHIIALHQVSLFSANENHKWRGSKMINEWLGDFVHQLVAISTTQTNKNPSSEANYTVQTYMVLNISLDQPHYFLQVMAWKLFN